MAVAGLVAVALFGQGDLAAIVGVGAAIAAMVLLDALHPPAGINALMPAYLPLDWRFIVMPVAVGAVALVVFAKLFHRLVRTEETPTPDSAQTPSRVPPAPSS